MGTAEEEPAGPGNGPRPLKEIVPPRAVLTELARGFLLVHETDRAHAARFAQSFLKEQIGAAPVARPGAVERISTVQRGVAAALRDRPSP